MNGDDTENTGVNRTGALLLGGSLRLFAAVLLSDMHGRGWSNSKALWPIASDRLYPASCRQGGTFMLVNVLPAENFFSH